MEVLIILAALMLVAAFAAAQHGFIAPMVDWLNPPPPAIPDTRHAAAILELCDRMKAAAIAGDDTGLLALEDALSELDPATWLDYRSGLLATEKRHGIKLPTRASSQARIEEPRETDEFAQEDIRKMDLALAMMRSTTRALRRLLKQAGTCNEEIRQTALDTLADLKEALRRTEERLGQVTAQDDPTPIMLAAIAIEIEREALEEVRDAVEADHEDLLLVVELLHLPGIVSGMEDAYGHLQTIVRSRRANG